MPGFEAAMGSDKRNCCLRLMEQYGPRKMTHLARTYLMVRPCQRHDPAIPPEARLPERLRPSAIRWRGSLAVGLPGWARLPLGSLVDGKQAGPHPTEGGRDALLHVRGPARG
jgi:hypothetical protein